MTGASCAGGPYTSLPSASTTRSVTTFTAISLIIPCVISVVSVRRQCSTGMSPSARTKESDDREHGSAPPDLGTSPHRGSAGGLGGHLGSPAQYVQEERTYRLDGGGLEKKKHKGQEGKE